MPDKSSNQMARQFLDRLEHAQSAVVLTGAGVSTASGIPDFRGPSGLFSKISQRTFEIEFFFAEPERYYEIAIEHIHTLADREPNPTHRMLAELEKRGMLSGVITQNIDGLHQKAGSQNVVEFHGDVTSFYCTKCDQIYDRDAVDEMIRANRIPICDKCESLIRPGIVFYGDMIPQFVLMDAQEMTLESEVFVAMGSSLTVNPAAALTGAAKQGGATVFVINRGHTPYDTIADYTFDVDLAEFSAAVIERLT